MTEDQRNAANRISHEIQSIESEISNWNYNARDEVVHPLALRMSGQPLRHIPPELFSEFKTKCISAAHGRIGELYIKFYAL